MTISSRCGIAAIAIAGACGSAVALSPGAAATPLSTGGYECIQTAAGEVGAPAAPAGCAPAAAPLNDMAGVPMALPGPIPVPPPVAPPLPPLAPPLPLGAPVPAGAPLGAPVAAGPVVAPLTDMAGSFGGKGAPAGPPPAGAPLPGQPILPGPAN